MNIADPLRLKFATPKEKIIFVVGQRQGKGKKPESVALTFRDECFVIADGVRLLPHGEVAAQLAAETAVWGYKQIRLRPYYWADKKLFMKRIFRSANLAVWQKRRETGFAEGLETALLVFIVGPRMLWVGSAGDSSAYLFHDGQLQQLTKPDMDEQGVLTKALGMKRLGLVPQYTNGRFEAGDTVLLVSGALERTVILEDIKKILLGCDESQERLQQIADQLLDTAQKRANADSLTALIIRRISSNA